MPKVKINAGGVNYAVANPDPRGAPLTAAAYNGQVVEMSQEEYDRLHAQRIKVDYTDPLTGVAAGAFRYEPAVVLASAPEAATAEATEQALAELRAAEDKVAQLRANLPAGAAAPAPALALASPGPRQLPDLEPEDGTPPPPPPAPGSAGNPPRRRG